MTADSAGPWRDPTAITAPAACERGELPLADELRHRLDALLADGTRRLLGIAGPPGAGKSTLAARVAATLPGRAVVVPMDGFHLAPAQLNRLGRADRKGAPDTFDAAGFVDLLRRLREDEGTVYAPAYHRELHHAVAAEIAVGSDVPLVVVEGNYLLLADHGFAPVVGLLDETWYVDLSDEERVRRLVARQVATGKTPTDAQEWVRRSDEANARLVAATARRADLRVAAP